MSKNEWLSLMESEITEGREVVIADDDRTVVDEPEYRWDSDETLVDVPENEKPIGEIPFKKENREVYHLQANAKLKERYIIGDVVGFGGFGVVYCAWDEHMQQKVAIKEYFPTMYLNRAPDGMNVVVFDKKKTELFEKGKTEFLQEARNIAKFNQHANIVHVYDYFEENGTAYFVMEFLEGDTLKKLIFDARSTNSTIELEKALGITKAVLNALSTTHKDGIIHRDIKPGNVYILPDGTVKLYDFGAARFADEEKERTRTIVITPGYAPPEQYQVRSKQGPYTDVYAVGAVLYEMLTGKKPDESINRKVMDELRAPNEMNSKVPKNISNAVMRALAVQPEIRFQTANEFAKALISPKQIRDAKAEIRHRKMRRNLKVLLLFLVIAGVSLWCVRQYMEQYRKSVLADASITLWAPAIEGDVEGTKELYQMMLEEYCTANPQINLEITILSEDTYVTELETALQKGEAPDVFESTGLDKEEYKHLSSLDELFTVYLTDSEAFYFMPEYAQYFPSKKQLPLTYDVPVVYENSLKEGLKDGTDYQKYLDNAINYCGMVGDYEQVQEDMAGIYQIREQIDKERKGVFTNLWSVNENSMEEEKAAAIRVIYYLLSDVAQEQLVLEANQNLPVNKNVWTIYAEVNSDFSYLTDIVEDVPMQGE